MTTPWKVHISDVLIFLLAVVGGSSLSSVIDGQRLYVVAVIGALIPALVTVLTRRLKLLATEAMAVSLVVMFVVGGFVASSSTAPQFREFFQSLTQGWADLLTISPPVPAEGKVLVLPFVLAWFASAVGFTLARVFRTPAIAALGALGAFAIGILFSIDIQSEARIAGALLLSLTLLLGWVQQRERALFTDETLGVTTTLRRRFRFAQGTVIIGAVALVAPLLAPNTPGLEARDRFDLRERLQPPFDPISEPSPLVQLKTHQAEPNQDEVVFVIEGNNLPSLLRLSTMGYYDGETWNIGDPSIANQAPFEQVDVVLPQDPRVNDEVYSDSTFTFTIRRVPPPEPVPSNEAELTTGEAARVPWDGPWLPMPPNPVAIQDLSPSLSSSLRFNPYSGALADPAKGHQITYEVTGASVVLTLSDLSVESDGFTFVPQERSPIPPEPGETYVEDWLADLWTADTADTDDDLGVDAAVPVADTFLDELRQFEAAITAEQPDPDGPVQAGTTDNLPPGHAWSRLKDIVKGDSLVGGTEQFAALTALAINEIATARVVVGFDIGENKTGVVELTRGQMSAWVEVLSARRGWIAIDVTPRNEEEIEPEDTSDPDPPVATEPNDHPEPVEFPVAPPPPPPPPDPPCEPDEEGNVSEECGQDPPATASGAVRRAGLVSAAATVPIFPVVLVLAAKSIRLRRRRSKTKGPHERVAGAWSEANDRLAELGYIPLDGETISERVNHVPLEGEALQSFIDLASCTDISAFGPAESVGPVADQAWAHYDDLAAELDATARVHTRVRRKIDPVPLARNRGW